MRDLKEIGDLLKRVRTEKGYSQSDLRFINGMTQQQISKLEKGHDIKLSNLLRVLEGYGLEIQIVSQHALTQPEDDFDSSQEDDVWAEVINHISDEI